MASLDYISIFAADIEALASFYQNVFALSEVAAYRTPVFRALDAGGVLLGFSSHDAYALLGLDSSAYSNPGSILLTFEVGGRDEVTALAERAATLGGSIMKPAFDTYYGAHQAVLTDPDGNLFRINYMRGS